MHPDEETDANMVFDPEVRETIRTLAETLDVAVRASELRTCHPDTAAACRRVVTAAAGRLFKMLDLEMGQPPSLMARLVEACAPLLGGPGYAREENLRIVPEVVRLLKIGGGEQWAIGELLERVAAVAEEWKQE